MFAELYDTLPPKLCAQLKRAAVDRTNATDAEKLAAFELEFKDLTCRIGDVVPWLESLADAERMPARARTLCEAGRRLFEIHSRDMHLPQRRVAYALMLDGLLAAPDAVMDVLQRMKDELAEREATLEMLSEQEADDGNA